MNRWRPNGSPLRLDLSTLCNQYHEGDSAQSRTPRPCKWAKLRLFSFKLAVTKHMSYPGSMKKKKKNLIMPQVLESKTRYSKTLCIKKIKGKRKWVIGFGRKRGLPLNLRTWVWFPRTRMVKGKNCFHKLAGCPLTYTHLLWHRYVDRQTGDSQMIYHTDVKTIQGRKKLAVILW